MSWIDDRQKQREEAFRREVLIEGSARGVFEELWTAVSACVTEAQSKKIPTFVNGTQFERKVALSVPPRFGQTSSNPKYLTIKLEGKEIVVDGLRQRLKLQLDVCENGVVCIKHKGAPMPVEELAVTLLDPFFFPEFAEPLN